MEQFLLDFLNYLLRVLISTLTQILVLFGPLLLLAFLMNFVAGQVEKFGLRVFGRKGYLYTFGWLGTSVHEIGHAVFALLFGHKITDMKLFSPDPDSGTLGYVNHSYNRSSFYQTFGNFFVGIGPILFGSVLLFIITWLLFRFSVTDIATVNITWDSLTHLSSLKIVGAGIVSGFRIYADLVFTGPYSSWWKILLLIYLLFSIGSSITLSPPDIQGSLNGFIYFIVVLLLFNLVTLWIGDFTLGFFRQISVWFSGFYFLIILSMLVNIVFLVPLVIVNSIKRR
ncbi:MAG: M50 family metallopeptidase [Bacteroidales bacterium]|nr:M50 family metallopeptidase [Bacteroidales bacterium]